MAFPRASQALSHYTVTELPKDPSNWLAVFKAAGYFEQTSFFREDRLRAGFARSKPLVDAWGGSRTST